MLLHSNAPTEIRDRTREQPLCLNETMRLRNFSLLLLAVHCGSHLPLLLLPLLLLPLLLLLLPLPLYHYTTIQLLPLLNYHYCATTTELCDTALPLLLLMVLPSTIDCYNSAYRQAAPQLTGSTSAAGCACPSKLRRTSTQPARCRPNQPNRGALPQAPQTHYTCFSITGP
jgi:hypothetical protein